MHRYRGLAKEYPAEAFFTVASIMIDIPKQRASESRGLSVRLRTDLRYLITS